MNQKFEHLIERAEQLIARIESVLPQPLSAPDWSAAIAWRYRKRSSGHGTLEPVRQVAAMALADLKEIDPQKEKIERNTQQFVRGLPANNVLLTGARGTGKSSLIKACLNAYAPQGLRLIEVDKADLTDLPDIKCRWLTRSQKSRAESRRKKRCAATKPHAGGMQTDQSHLLCLVLPLCSACCSAHSRQRRAGACASRTVIGVDGHIVVA